MQGLVNVRFPSGRLSSRAGRVLEVALIAGIVLALAAGVLGDYKLRLVRPDSTVVQVANPLTGGTAVGRYAAGLSVVVPLVVLLGLIAGLGVLRRAWKATGIERYQLRWRAYGVVLSLLLFPLAVNQVLPTAVDVLDGLFFVTTLAIPVVRYRLWAIDTVIRRSAAYALVTIAVVGGFAAIAAIGTAVASERVGFIVAAAGAAVTFAPARSYSQRLVDHFFYGQRSEPYRALSDWAGGSRRSRRRARCCPLWSLWSLSRCGCRTWRSSGQATARSWRPAASQPQPGTRGPGDGR